MPHRDAFVSLDIPTNRLAIQVIHAANRIAAAGLTLADAQQRMAGAYPDRTDGRYKALNEAIERGKRGDCNTTDEHRHRGFRHAMDETAQALHVALAGPDQHGARAKEQQALEQRND